MNEITERLVACFSAIFPSLSQAEIVEVDMSSLEAWDSLASVRLLAVIGEEFAVRIPPKEISRLVSFERIRDYLADWTRESSR